jgi:integrase
VSWRASRNRWVARLQYNKRQYKRQARTREEAEAKLAALRAELGLSASAGGPVMTGKRANNEGSVYFQRSKNRWVGTLLLEDGTRRYMFGATREQAHDKLIDALKKRKDNLPQPGDKLTVGVWLDYWLDNIVKPDREPTTYEQYEIAVRCHIKPAIGTRPLAKLTVENVEGMLRRMATQGTGLRTRKVALARLRTALELATARGHTARNVASLVKMPSTVRRRVAPPDLADMLRLIDMLHDDPMEALVLVGLGAGLRRGEVLGLHWEDIDLAQRTLVVNRHVSRVKGQLLIREGAKTDAGERLVVLPMFVTEALQRHATRQKALCLATGPLWRGPDYRDGLRGPVFTSGWGTVLDPRNTNRAFERVRKLAGLDATTFHGLRHNFASLMLLVGVDRKVTSDLMGHTNAAITMNVYQHTPDALKYDAADRLDALLRPLPAPVAALSN